MIRQHFDFEENTIMELVITVGEYEIVIDGNKVGLFELSGISKLMNKFGTSMTGYKADGLLLELHHDLVGEVELLVKEMSRNSGAGICSIEVIHTDSMASEKYSVYEAFRNYHFYRVNSAGDLRIILGSQSDCLYLRHFEVSPSCFFDINEDSHSACGGMYAALPELKAKNYKGLVYGRMRKIAGIIAAMQKYSDMDTHKARECANADGAGSYDMFILYLSIFDKYIQYKYNRQLCISSYTYYDEDLRQWKNDRVTNIMRWYPNISPDAEYKDDMQSIHNWLQYKNLTELGMVYYQVCNSSNNSFFKDSIND